MQLGFQTIPKPNAQIIETYKGVIIWNNRMCTGACLRAAAQSWGQTDLGPGSHASPPGLAPAAPAVPQSPHTRCPQLWMLHECIWDDWVQFKLYNHYTVKRNVLRTVRAQMADRPQFNYAVPPEPPTSLGKTQPYTADCPHSNRGPTAG